MVPLACALVWVEWWEHDPWRSGAAAAKQSFSRGPTLVRPHILNSSFSDWIKISTPAVTWRKHAMSMPICEEHGVRGFVFYSVFGLSSVAPVFNSRQLHITDCRRILRLWTLNRVEAKSVVLSCKEEVLILRAVLFCLFAGHGYQVLENIEGSASGGGAKPG